MEVIQSGLMNHSIKTTGHKDLTIMGMNSPETQGLNYKNWAFEIGTIKIDLYLLQ